MARLTVHLLGPPEIHLDGNPVSGLHSDKVRALLFYLAVERGLHRRETLAGLLWPDYPERSARTNLSNTLSHLRTALNDRTQSVPFLHIDRQTILWNTESDTWVDASAFAEHVVRAQWGEAVDVYRGSFLDGFSLPDSPAFEQWVVVTRERLQRQAMAALEHLAVQYEESGDLGQAIRASRRQIEIEPGHEEGHRALMRLLALDGQRSAALAQYEACVDALAQELGVAPSPETVALYEQIREGSVTPDLTGLSNLSGLDALPPRHNLPAHVTSFIGRQGELAALGGLLQDPASRLVTVVGPGGMGKTRLAIEAARELLGESFDEAWLVELAPVPDDETVPRTVASALGVRERSDLPLPESIALSLQTRNLLLVVDNCEHVVDGAAALVDTLLARCPDLTILTTSREPLHVAGEYLYEVPPMALPEKDSSADGGTTDALQLFCRRAAAVQIGFALDEETVPLVADICRHLDGMPLAIELAAARLRMLSLHEIAHQLDDRFRLLTGGSRTALPRQRTLYNTVEWSYDLLDEAERALFDRLSVFEGSFSLQAAEEVCAGSEVHKKDLFDLLSNLVDKSLVATVPGPEGETRYRLLETLRAYGQERLAKRGKLDDLASRHAWYYVTFAEGEEPILYAHEKSMIASLDRVDAEEENLAAAMRWSLSHQQPEVTLRIGGAVHTWAMHRGDYGQYAAWILAARALDGDVAPLYLAKSLDLLSNYYGNEGRSADALAAGQQELEMARKAESPRWVGWGLGRMGIASGSLGQHERAQSLLQESMDIAYQCRDRRLICVLLPFAATYESRVKQRTLLEEFLPQASRYGKPWLHYRLAGPEMNLGNLTAAEDHLVASLSGWRDLGNSVALATIYVEMADVSTLRGDYDRSDHLLELAYSWALRADFVQTVRHVVENTGWLAWLRGDQERAREYLQQSLDLAHRYKKGHVGFWVYGLLALVACEGAEYDRAERLCTQALDALPEQAHGGRRWVFLALGRITFHRGGTARAVDLYRQALDHARYGEARLDATMMLEYLTWALAANDQCREAACLLACTARERDEMGVVLYPVDRPYHERAMETVRNALGEQALAAAWAEGEALSLDEAVARALGQNTD